MSRASQADLYEAVLRTLNGASPDRVAQAIAAGADVEHVLSPSHPLSKLLPALVASDLRHKVPLGLNPSLVGGVLVSDVDKGAFDAEGFKKLPAVLMENGGKKWDRVPIGGTWRESGQPCSVAYLFQHVEDVLRAGRIYAEKVRFPAVDFVSCVAPHLSEKGVRSLGADLAGVISEAAVRNTLFMATSSALAMLDEFASHWDIPAEVHDHMGRIRILSTAHQFLFKDFVADPEYVSLVHVAASNPGTQSRHPVLLLERLIDGRCDIEVRSSKLEMTPLMCAARAGRPSMMKILLDAGADHRACDAQGRTARDHVELLKDGETKRLALSVLQSICARQAVSQVLRRARADQPANPNQIR